MNNSAIYARLLAKYAATRTGVINSGKASREWFRSAARSVRGVSSDKLFREASPVNLIDSGRLTLGQSGKMLLYSYDPKHKKTLPYYDRLPLIFITSLAKGGFYGINLHYLPPKQRAQLFDIIVGIIDKNKNNPKRVNMLTWKMLKRASKYPLYKPCIKRYLFGHVRSKMYTVPREEWDMTLMLPIEKFEKLSKRKVFEESLKKVNV
jgi:hypothetical protein